MTKQIPPENALKKQKKLTPWNYIDSILNKTYIDNMKWFSPYLTQVYFSAHQLFLPLANANINLIGTHRMSKKAIYDYFYYSIPKGKIFAKFPKGPKSDEVVTKIMKYYNVNDSVAKDYLDVISDEDLKMIDRYFLHREQHYTKRVKL